jgi:hypothetical protein
MSVIDDSQAGAYAPAFRKGAERFVALHPDEIYHITASRTQSGLCVTISGGRLKFAHQFTLNPVLDGQLEQSVFDALEQVRSQAH